MKKVFTNNICPNLQIWDKDKKCITVKFVNGSYETEDEEIINFLQSQKDEKGNRKCKCVTIDENDEYEKTLIPADAGEVFLKEKKPFNEYSKEEMIEELTEQGIEFNARDKKAVLYELLGE